MTSLSDKILNADDCIGKVIFAEDVREKIQDFNKELKEFEASKTLGGGETDHLLISYDELVELALKHFGRKLM